LAVNIPEQEPQVGQARELARQDATDLVQRFGELGRRKFQLAA